MAKRKLLSKKTRFEVFKRDKFTCQYCGSSAPDVVLEVDHIVPVAEGGTDDIMNLVTSCFDCNRGKGKTSLTDDSAVKVRKAQLDKIAERNEQIEMMYEWQLELANGFDRQVGRIADLIEEITGYIVSDDAREDIRDLVTRFGFDVVIDSTRIALTTYRTGDEDEMDYAFSKIGGICYNKTHKTCSQCVNRVYYDSCTSKYECGLEEVEGIWHDNRYAEECGYFYRMNRGGGRHA